MMVPIVTNKAKGTLVPERGIWKYYIIRVPRHLWYSSPGFAPGVHPQDLSPEFIPSIHPQKSSLEFIPLTHPQSLFPEFVPRSVLGPGACFRPYNPQYAERILNKTAKAINKTFAGLKLMLQGFIIYFV